MTDQAYRLGKQPPREDARTLSLAHYLTTSRLPAPPKVLDDSAKVPAWGMFGNDRYGDCVFAALGHQVELWTALDGSEATLTDAEILAGYSAVTGFNPQTGANDNGTVELDALNWLRHSGLAGHSIYAFAAVKPTQHTHVKQALSLFGGLLLGLALPLSAQDQVGKVWDVAASSRGRAGSWGGHAVNVVGYDASEVLCITWGQVQAMTWRFFNRYCDEAWALLSNDWQQRTPVPGFDFAALQADLAQFGRVNGS